uniref:Uncharacterized protein n=1 Tax=Triticum aestivum TaxID=4565 RepID=A0A077RRT3_WHEAT|nr:unnamed protein product [Triticum aestivum]
MTVIDFKDLSDHDIIDLSSSDDEIVQEDHIATKHRAASLDRQTMHVIAGVGIQDVQAAFVATSEGRQDVQALFAAASEGRQEAADCGYALEVTTSSLVTEKEPLVAASEGSQDVQAVLVAALEGSQDVQAAFVVASEGSQDVQAVLVATTEGRQEVAHSGNALEATASSLVTEKAPLDMAESHNCPRSPTSATFPSPTSTVLEAPTSEGGDAKLLPAKALTSEGGDAELVRGKLKHPRENYPAGTPRTSPRFEPKCECHNGSVEELPAEVLTSEGGNAKLLRGKVKHPRMNYHTSTPRISPRFVPKLECHNRPVEELPAEALTSEGGNEELVRGKLKHPRKNYHAGTPRTSPRFEQKLDCRNGTVEELPAEALISEGGDAELVRGKVKRPKKNYHTGTPRTSPRFEPKRECHNGSVEQMPAEVLTSEGGDAQVVRGERNILGRTAIPALLGQVLGLKQSVDVVTGLWKSCQLRL